MVTNLESLADDTVEAILIAGPTASGKSALALDLAEQIGGTVINADSMQVYGDLRILTARPNSDEEARVPHLLYGHVSAIESYSVGKWLEDVQTALQQCRLNRRVALVTGGTGFYFSSLLKGLSPIPDISDDVRTAVRMSAAERSAEDLHKLLEQKDPLMAVRLGTRDTQRICRALEVIEATGTSLAVWQTVPATPLLETSTTRRMVLAPERGWVRDRIAARFDQMLDQDVLDEVRTFMTLNVPEDRPCARAHGVRPLAAYLRGQVSREAAIERSVNETRQYAKRQDTWFRNQFQDWQRVSVG